jgi:acyl transferase domain-containing protein
VGRAAHRFRVAVAGATRDELAEHLRAVAAGQRPVARLSNQAPPVGFLFTGQGSQYLRMGERLYATEPAFRDALDECAALLAEHLEHPLLSVVFGDDPDRLTQTVYAQAGIVAVQVALVRLLEAWGVRPDMAVGHSVGELTAAWAAGVFTLPDLMRLTAVRGKAMQAAPAGGAMAVVHADADTVHALLAQHPRVEVAAYNAPRNLTLSGPADAIDALCATAGHPTQALTVSHAFHSAAMAEAVPTFTRAVAETTRAAATIPVASTVTGTWHTPESITDPGTWGGAIRKPVRFSEAIGHLAAAGARVLWEIGPHPVLTALGKATLPDRDLLWLSTLRRGRNDQRQLHDAVAAFYNDGGHDLAWAGPHDRKGHAAATIPSYPFQRQSFWISPTRPNPARVATPQPISARHH